MLQFYPASEGPAAFGLKLPADFAGKPETSIVGGAAANSDDALASAAFLRHAEDDSKPACVQIKWVVFTAGQLRQTDDASGFDDGGGGFGVPPPTGGDGAVRCVDGFGDNRLSADEGTHDLAKSIAAIAHRQQFERVPGPGATPSAGNRLGGVIRRERAFEFVGDDEGLHWLERMRIRGTAQGVNDCKFRKLFRDMDCGFGKNASMDNVQCRTPVRPVRDLPEFVAPARKRSEFVQEIFDHTAAHYDTLSAALSFGTCRAYRRMALRRAGLTPGMKMLDVATGTGLVARAALQLGLAAQDIVGVDPSRGMLDENRRAQAISLVQGFGEALPFADESFDFISMGYALRHVEDLVELFSEYRRVLKKVGRVLVLEITRPASRIGTNIGRFYMCRILPTLARVLTRSAETATLMRFYWTTIEECVPPSTILAALEASGLKEVKRRTTGSVLSDYMARRLD